MTGEFLCDGDNAKPRRPKEAAVRLARLKPDEPPIAVRMAFHSQGSREAALYVR